MIYANKNYQFLLFPYLIILTIFQSDLIIGQACQNDIRDFFVSFHKPTSTPKFSVSSPNGTTVFTFNVQPETIYTRPSFVSTSVTGRSLNNTPGIITVTSSNPSFAVTTLANGSYALVTNTL